MEETAALDPVGGGKAVYVYRASDCFDTNMSGIGHQARGFDQMMVFYNHFRVLGSKIRAVPLISTTVPYGYYGVTLSDEGNLIAGCANVQDVLERAQRNTRLKMCGQVAMIDPKFSGVTQTYSQKRFFRGRNLKGTEFQGDVATSPVENAFFEVWIASAGGGDPAAIQFIVQIDFIVMFEDQNETYPQS